MPLAAPSNCPNPCPTFTPGSVVQQSAWKGSIGNCTSRKCRARSWRRGKPSHRKHCGKQSGPDSCGQTMCQMRSMGQMRSMARAARVRPGLQEWPVHPHRLQCGPQERPGHPHHLPCGPQERPVHPHRLPCGPQERPVHPHRLPCRCVVCRPVARHDKHSSVCPGNCTA